MGVTVSYFNVKNEVSELIGAARIECETRQGPGIDHVLGGSVGSGLLGHVK